MKVLLTGCLVLFAFCSFGQHELLLERMSTDLSRQLEDLPLRGKKGHFGFLVDSAGINIEPTTLDRELQRRVKEVLDVYKDSLERDIHYEVSIYFDEYSTGVYPLVYKPVVWEEPTFACYIDLPFLPKGGRVNFMESVYKDLARHSMILDTLSSKEWLKTIKILLEYQKKPSVISDGVLGKLLDSSLVIPWTPGIYYAWPVINLVSISVDKSLVYPSNLPTGYAYYDQVFKIENVLQEKYKNQPVLYKNDQPKPEGRLVVSFVLNLMTGKLEHPLIHEGDIDEAGSFITWLEGLQRSEYPFYWSPLFQATRSYFYLPPQN